MIRKVYNKATDESTKSFSLTGEGPYAFKTLWQEITKGIQAVMNSIANISITRSNNSAQTQQFYWLQAREGDKTLTNNVGFYIIIGLLILAATTIIITNKK